jgi:hypothetical protein
MKIRRCEMRGLTSGTGGPLCLVLDEIAGFLDLLAL